MTEEERFERALEAAARDRSPCQPIAGLSTEHLRMVQFAQLLRGSRGQGPEAEFIERLHARLFRSECSP